MIVLAGEAIKRSFLGVDFVVLARGAKSMVTKMLYKENDFVPLHKHPNEQSGYIISGRYKIRFGEYEQIVGPSDSYSIPENVDHTLEIIEPGQVIDVFTPPREDYL